MIKIIKYTNRTMGYTKVGDMTENKEFTVKKVIKQYYGDEELYSEYAEEVDKILSDLDHESIKEKCLSSAQEKENKVLHIGKFVMSKAACMVVGVCIITILCGFGYAVVSGYIKGIKIKDMDDHSEVEFEYHDNLDADKVIRIPSEIEEYYEPVWVPDGYIKIYEKKDDISNVIIYESVDQGLQIVYHQDLIKVKRYYNSIDGKHEEVLFGRYSGEYIETTKSNYLIVTDGIYLYSIIADCLNKDDLIKMISETK